MSARENQLQAKFRKAVGRFRQSNAADHTIKRIRQLRRYHQQCLRKNCVPTLPARQVLFLGMLLGSGIASAQQPIPLADEETVIVDGNQVTPSIGMNKNGDYVIAWSAGGIIGDDEFGIYAQRYAADGSALAGSFRVNTYTTSFQIFTSVALDDDGDFVIVWSSNGQDGSGYGVYMQRYDNQGQTVGVETRVNTITLGTQEEPDIAMDADGDFVIVWEAAGTTLSNGITTCYRRYDKNGIAIDAVEKNWHPERTLDAYNPSVSMTDDGRFIIATEYGRTTNTNKFDIHYAEYGSHGMMTGSSVLGYRITEDAREPDVAMDSDGDFVIAYESRNGASSRIFLHVSSGTYPDQRVDIFQSGNRSQPAVALDSDGDFVISWTRYLYGNVASEFYARSYVSNGTQQGQTFQVDQAITGYRNSGDVAMQANGDFIAIWRNDDIYQRRYGASDVELLCSNIGIADIYEFLPKVAMDSDGDHVVAWTTGNSGDKQFKFKRYARDGRPTTSAIAIATEDFIVSPNLAMDAVGNFVAVWDSDGACDIKLRPYSASGNAVSGEMCVAPSATSKNSPDVAMAPSGEYVVVFREYGPTERIIMQRYDANHNELGVPVQVDNSGLDCDQPAVVRHASGDFSVTWRANDDIYLRRFDQNGNPLTGDILVNSDHTTDEQRKPDIAMDEDGEMVVVWSGKGPSSTTNDLIYQRLFNPNGAALTNTIAIKPEAIDQVTPKIAISHDGTKVITFERSDQIALIAYQQDGTIFFQDLEVASEIGGNRYRPEVAIDADGDFITAHSRDASDEFSLYTGVYKRLYATRPSSCLKHSLFLDGLIPSDEYRAAMTIEALGEVALPSQVTFKTGESISLTEGFEVKAGATFLAQIEGCP